MKTGNRRSLSSLQVTVFSLILAAVVSPTFAADKQKVLIPFDFVSRFDNGRYGAAVGDMVWKKVQRVGGFILPESMLDVRDTCERNHAHPAPDMPLERVKKIVEDDFGGQIGIWGSVERVPGHEEDVYDLAIRCVDFSAPGGPKVVYQCNASDQSGQRDSPRVRETNARRSVRASPRETSVARSRGG